MTITQTTAWPALLGALEAMEDELRAQHQANIDLVDRLKEELRLAEDEVAVSRALLSLLGSQLRNDVEPTLTLHEAMVSVLRDNADHRLRAGALAAEINRRNLYRMRDGRPVEAQQIHARVGHYAHLFRKEGQFIALADGGDAGKRA